MTSSVVCASYFCLKLASLFDKCTKNSTLWYSQSNDRGTNLNTFITLYIGNKVQDSTTIPALALPAQCNRPKHVLPWPDSPKWLHVRAGSDRWAALVHSGWSRFSNYNWDRSSIMQPMWDDWEAKSKSQSYLRAKQYICFYSLLPPFKSCVKCSYTELSCTGT